MAIFDYTKVGDLSLRTLDQRFESAELAEGIEEWRLFARTIAGLADNDESAETGETLVAELNLFIQTLTPRSKAKRQTVFVSHQRANTAWAERVAWEAVNAGFDYWLDAHDSLLLAVPKAPLAPAVQAVLVAAIIEVALLNCTHLVSLQTSASKASHWVPYELGRAKHRLTVASHTASWFETGIGPHPGGDYLSLTVCAPTKADLLRWFANVKPTTPQNPQPLWGQPVTPPDLPN